MSIVQLTSSADAFHTTALTLYMNRFDFTHIALDVALRRFLMHMSLPKETQQIDRVIEAFATRYDLCEPGLFGTKGKFPTASHTNRKTTRMSWHSR